VQDKNELLYFDLFANLRNKNELNV